MSRSVRRLASNRKDTFDPQRVHELHPWISERNQDCIVSPDADGLICGLFMSHHCGWRIRGFYDGKVLVCDEHVRAADCVFLDMEINRKGVRSVGQHMLLFNKNHVPANWSNFDDCFSINNHRGYDANQEFSLKYPFGTIHFLLAALQKIVSVTLPETAVAPLLFIDGTYHNLFRYTENSLDWLRYLRITEPGNPLHRLFMEDEHTIHRLMSLMDTFWEARDQLSVPRQRGDRIAITRRGGKGEMSNLSPGKNDLFDFDSAAKARGEAFLRLLGEATGWQYDQTQWSWEAWRVSVFEKEQLVGINIPKFKDLMAREPLSLAITAGNRIEYTLDPDAMFISS